MTDFETERRVHKRVYFSIEDGVVGEFTVKEAENSVSFVAPILNLSVGGIHFTLEKGQGRDIRIGDVLNLIQIKDRRKLVIVFDIVLEVRWVLNHEELDYVGYGCEFKNVPQEVKTRVSQFVEYVFSGKENSSSEFE